MKNLYTTILTLFLSVSIAALTAQDTVYYEDFEDGMPPEYSLFDLDGNTPHPNVGEYTQAWIVLGGAASSTSWYSPVGTSNDWMITGAIELPDLQNPENQIRISWEDYAPDENYLDGYKVMITTKAAHPDSFETELFSINAAGNDPDFTARSVNISEYAGDSVYIAFVNNSVDKFRLYIDNISITRVPQFGLNPVNVINPRYNSGPDVEVGIEFYSIGYTDVQSFQYVFDNGVDEPDTVSIDNTSLEYLESGVWNHAQTVSGRDTLQCDITIISVNGEDVPDATYTEPINVYDESETSARRPMVETFTSSSCAPCKPGNENLHGILDELINPPVVLKWQQNFPGNGDPYCTSETINRRGFYGINAIPNTNVDGTYFDDNTNFITESDITGAREFGALLDIEAQYVLDPDDHSIRVFGTVMARVPLWDGNRLMIAVKELTTTNNVTTNGETEFFDVVKKVLPDLDGTSLPAMEPGDEFSFDMTYTFPGDYRLPANGLPANRIDLETEHSVEEFTDLAASVWVEYPEDRQILAANEADEATAVEDIAELEEYSLSPNPVVYNDLRLSMTLKESSEILLEVYNISGQPVWNKDLGLKSGTMQIALPTNTLPAGPYFIKVRVGEQAFVDRFVKQ